MTDDIPVRVARLEERTKNLEDWREVLTADIRETQALIDRLRTEQRQDLADLREKDIKPLNEKLDRALLAAERRVPTWVYYLFGVLIALLGILGGRLWR
jgi:type VI protein secretion system component VasF